MTAATLQHLETLATQDLEALLNPALLEEIYAHVNECVTEGADEGDDLEANKERLLRQELIKCASLPAPEGSIVLPGGGCLEISGGEVVVQHGGFKSTPRVDVEEYPVGHTAEALLTAAFQMLGYANAGTMARSFASHGRPSLPLKEPNRLW